MGVFKVNEFDFELNSNITALKLGGYAWLVANFVQGESDRDKLND